MMCLCLCDCVHIRSRVCVCVCVCVCVLVYDHHRRRAFRPLAPLCACVFTQSCLRMCGTQLLSPALAEFLGAEEMSRGDVVKALHAYFKAHDLQDKSNGQNILFDDKLQALFKCKKTTFFKLNKLLTKHLADAGEVVA